jgi:phosphoribosylamine--glycine ligase
MKILVIGSGGREHTLVWKLNKSPLVKEIYCTPGNAGITQIAKCEDIPVEDTRRLSHFARKRKIDLTVVGPEAPLVNGIVDEFESESLPIFGPSQRAAELEGSKVFTKHFLKNHNIPTAKFIAFSEFEKAEKYLKSAAIPIVIKADGLAAGKGAIVCRDRQSALDALKRMMVEKVFGPAGDKVVIEECLLGEEASVLALTDGEHLVYLAPAQDHKPIFDDDNGPNTGGMGAYAPAPVVDSKILQRIKTEIMEPTVRGMALEDRPYRGVLYAGLMITDDGPKIIEYNCRFGDPETQAILPLVETDLLETMMDAKEGQINKIRWQESSRAAVCVVMASAGYPGAYEKGKPIKGLDRDFGPDTIIFHAGTKKVNGSIVTNGGRVLGVTSVSDTVETAMKKAYQSVRKITFNGAYYRKDIGAKAIKRMQLYSRIHKEVPR